MRSALTVKPPAANCAATLEFRLSRELREPAREVVEVGPPSPPLPEAEAAVEAGPGCAWAVSMWRPLSPAPS